MAAISLRAWEEDRALSGIFEMIIGDIRVLPDCLITFKCLRTGKLNSSLRADETAMTQHQWVTQRHPGHSAPANSEGCRAGCRGSSQCPEGQCHWKKETKGNLIWRRSKWSQCTQSCHQGSWGCRPSPKCYFSTLAALCKKQNGEPQ